MPGSGGGDEAHLKMKYKECSMGHEQQLQTCHPALHTQEQCHIPAQAAVSCLNCDQCNVYVYLGFRV